MKRLYAAVIVALLVEVCASACLADEGPAALQAAVTESMQRLHNAGYKFGKTLAPVFREEEVDVPMARKEFEAARKEIDSVVEDVNQISAPDSEATRELRAAFQKYVEFEKSTMEIDVPLIFKIIEDKTLSPKTKKDKIDGLLDAADAREKQTVAAQLRQALVDFAEAYDLSTKTYTVWVYRRVNDEWVKQEDRTLVTTNLKKAREYVATTKKYKGWTATTNVPE